MNTQDPVCGMMLSLERAAAKTEYKGNIYYFCSVEDVEKFKQSPDKYMEEPAGVSPSSARERSPKQENL